MASRCLGCFYLDSCVITEFGIKFFETSAKLNTNVDQAFMSIAKDIVERLKVNPEHYGSDGGMKIKEEKKNESKSCC